MNWLAWRQHRKQFLVLAVLLAAFAALLIPTGIQFWNAYQSVIATCVAHPATPSCSSLHDSVLQSRFEEILLQLEPVAILFLPIILGMFWGAPLLAKEYTEGTNSLAWTQSVSRRKWLTIQLIWVFVATIVLIGAFAVLSTWWSRTPNALNIRTLPGVVSTEHISRFNAPYFDSQNIVVVAYALFAVAFGILFGTWFRRIMVAVGLTLGLCIALMLIVVPNFVRPYYMTPVTVTAAMGPGAIDGKIPTGAWVLSRKVINSSGKAVEDIFPTAPPQCQKLIQEEGNQQAEPGLAKNTPVANPIDVCLNAAGWHQIAKYQPANRYWEFQWIEAAIFLALTLIAIGATYWLVLKRDA